MEQRPDIKWSNNQTFIDTLVISFFVSAEAGLAYMQL